MMGLFKNMTVKLTHRILAGGLHDLTEADADALPLVTLVGAQSLLQDGNNLRENLLPQFSHQISQRSSSDLKPQPNTASVKKVLWDDSEGVHVFAEVRGAVPFSCRGR